MGKTPTFWKAHQKNKPAGYFSEEFKDMINAMLSLDPNERPTMEQLMSSAWM